MSPGKVKRHRELFSIIEEWHIRVDALSRNHGEVISEQIRIAALVQIFPGDIMDVRCQSLGAQS